MMICSHKWSLVRLLLSGIPLGLAMIGCVASDPFQPPLRDEIPDGPGLFTGSKGAWVISREFGARPAPIEVDEPRVEPSVPQAQPSESSSLTPVAPSIPAIPKPKTPPL